jgi:hypothetical protein
MQLSESAAAQFVIGESLSFTSAEVIRAMN